jgi:predicted dehydrogenase
LITTPPHLHLEIAHAAIKNNIHLFIEKPLGMSSKGWQNIYNICKKKNIKHYTFAYKNILNIDVFYFIISF